MQPFEFFRLIHIFFCITCDRKPAKSWIPAAFLLWKTKTMSSLSASVHRFGKTLTCRSILRSASEARYFRWVTLRFCSQTSTRLCGGWRLRTRRAAASENAVTFPSGFIDEWILCNLCNSCCSGPAEAVFLWDARRRTLSAATTSGLNDSMFIIWRWNIWIMSI